MPRGRGQPPRAIPAGTRFGSWQVIREMERVGTNRRFECRCTGCETVKDRWLANLVQGKTTCLVCVPMATINQPGRDAVIAVRRAQSQESDAGRICLTCSEWKPWEKFSTDPRRTRGKTSNCIDCAYWRTIKAIYGITREEWDWLRASQNGVCALCGESDTVRLNIDHDHACHPTGRACKKCIRGMLCRVCNRMLGHIEAKPALRARFVDYLDNRPLLARTTEQMKSRVRPIA